MDHSPQRRACLYRYFSAEGDLLYIGVTRNPANRHQGHRCYSPWFWAIARKTEEWFDNEGDAYAAEKVAIRAEDPICNRLRYAA